MQQKGLKSNHHWTWDQKPNAKPGRTMYTPVQKTIGQAPLDAHHRLKSGHYGGPVAPSACNQSNTPKKFGKDLAQPDALGERTTGLDQNDGFTTSTTIRTKRKWTQG
eukprot:8093447-Ditylum_brightwellii.AAC.1